MFNMQAQYEYFNGGAIISMEGVALLAFLQLDGSSEKQMEFHTHLSGGKLQDSSILQSLMDKSIWF